MLVRAEFAVYVQALQRRAHAPRIKDCKRFGIVIRHMKRHKCGIRSIALNHPVKLGVSTDAAFKAQPEEPPGLAFRGLAATLCEDEGDATKPHASGAKVNFVDFMVRRQRGVVRSTFSAEFNGLVDSAEQVLRLQCTLH